MDDRASVNDMHKLITLMNNNAELFESNESEPNQIQRAAYVDQNTEDMKRILESFYSSVDNVAQSAPSSPRLQEAINTSKTPTGVRIGTWEVRAKLHESKLDPKTYSVSNAQTKEVLFADLVILEAAHAIVRYLNKGVDPKSVKINEIADLEETFRRNRQDASVFKKRYQRCIELKEEEAGSVFHARYQRAKAQAVVANDQIKTILDNIR
jgi:hypothetical protein